MDKRFSRSKLLPLAFLVLALSACQSEMPVEMPTLDNMREVTLTGMISKGDLQTRTNISLNDDETKLVMTWNVGEPIYVSDENGKYLGNLKVTSLANEEGTLAKFVGQIITPDRDGEHNVYFYLLGNKKPYEGKINMPMGDMAYDFSNQTSSDVNALADNDLMLTPGKIQVKSGNAKFNDLTLRRQFAFGRFTLLYDNKPLEFGEGGAVITIDTENGDIKTDASVSFPESVSASRDGSISLRASVNDFYVTFVPGSEMSRIKFNVTINGEEYEGYTYKSYIIEKNDFFRKNGGGAYPINVKHTDGRDEEKAFKLIYHENFGSNHSGSTWEDTYTATAPEHTFTVKDNYKAAFTDGAINESLYEFKGWTTSNQYLGNNLYEQNDYKLTYDAKATDKGLVGHLYAYWWALYKITFELGEGVTGQTPEAADGPSNAYSVTMSDLPNDKEDKYDSDYKGFSKPGYEFVGWTEKGHEGDVVSTDGTWKLEWNKPQVVLVPVWNKLPESGITTPGYEGGTWGKK